MITASDIMKYYHLREGEQSPIKSIDLHWCHKLDAAQGYATLVVSTDRKLTTDGGDGWTGFDSSDLSNLHSAIRSALLDDGSYSMIDQFVVKSTQSS